VATDLVAIETAILARLDSLRATYGIAIGLLDAQELARPVQSGQVFVSYDGSTFTPQPTYSHAGQGLRVIRFAIISRYANLRTHDRAYPLLGAIRDKLSGWQPVARVTTRPFRQVSETFVSQFLADAIWQYEQLFEFELLEG